MQPAIVLTPPAVVSSPQQRLLRWRVWEVQVPAYDAPSWHIIGHLTEAACAKVSSALATVSAAGDEAVSKTGSVYGLLNPPGVDAIAAQLWDAWRRQHGVVVLREVTSDVLAGRQPPPLRLVRRPGAREAASPAGSLRGLRPW